MKKIKLLMLVTIMALTSIIPVYGLTDTYIFTDPVRNTYIGRTEARDMIKNINFNDTKGNQYAENIARVGALDIIKGYNNNFEPNRVVSNEEIISVLMRMLGLEANAQANAVDIAARQPAGTPLTSLWSLGYLQEAVNVGLLTQGEYNQALALDQSVLEEPAFIRQDPAKRENIAYWIALTLNFQDPEAFPLDETIQRIYTYSDFGNISPNRVSAVETITEHGIMGANENTFNPKGSITRGEMAHIISNIDSIYYEINEMTKMKGTVGGIKDAINTTTGQYDGWKNIFVRNEDGFIDVLQYQHNSGNSPQVKERDIPVFKDGNVAGLLSLEEGDEIEYIVKGNISYYVSVTTPMLVETMDFGKLYEVNLANGIVRIKDVAKEEIRSYTMANGMYGKDNVGEYITIDGKKIHLNKLPYGSGINLHMKNNIVSSIEYVGEDILITELRGIVIENNPDFGYMRVFNNQGNKVTFNYNTGDLLVVEKQQYYDNDDEIGYIDQVFPNFDYDPRDTTIDQIEVGDIVFIRPSEEDPSYIESISASPNYTMKYGKIKNFVINDDMINMSIEFDNGVTSMYSMAYSVFITKDGIFTLPTDVQVGDYAKVLVNSAIIDAGYVVESVKELILEGNDRFVTQIVKGQISGINLLQGQLQIQKASEMSNTGWTNYSQVKTFNLKDRNIEIYFQGNRISLDYAERFLKRGDNEAYIAIENNYSGEVVKVVSIYSGRDSFIKNDTVIDVDGSGNFTLSNGFKNYATDQGTIVVRNGRLVSPQNILPYDYAKLAINGGNNAAVVDITQREGNNEILVARGRILSVNEGEYFTVQSMAMLDEDKWVMTPVQRVFEIDNDTIFINGSGNVYDINEFLDYTPDSVYNNVYNIIADGTVAKFVVTSPYSKEMVKGMVYKNEDNTLSLKDMLYLDTKTNTWKVISNANNTATITIPQNGIVLKNNNVVPSNNIVIGNEVQVYTDALDYSNMTPGMSIDGYIIDVQK